MSSEIDPRAFGQMEAAVEALGDRMRSVEDKLDSKFGDLEKKVQSLSDMLTEARGGWRMALLLGGGAATAGAGLTWVLQHITFR